MPDHADQAAPGPALLLPQRLAEVGDHHQAEGAPALAEAVPHHLPAPAAGREDVRLGAQRRPVQQARDAGLLRAQADQRAVVALEQFPRGAVGEPDALLVVEGQDGDVDLGQHLVEQRRGFQRLEPLGAQRGAQAVGLRHHVAERIAAARVPAADAEVPGAQRLQHVRDGAQRLHGRAVQGHGEAEPRPEHDERQQHEHGSRQVEARQQREGQRHRRRTAGQRQQHHAPLEQHARASRDRTRAQRGPRGLFRHDAAGVCALAHLLASRVRSPRA